MKMTDAMQPPKRGRTVVESQQEAMMRAHMIEASQGGCYSGSKFMEMFEQPAVRPVPARRKPKGM